MQNTSSINSKVDLLNQTISSLEFGTSPVELYEPIRYIMSLGGKRLRPLLTLLSYELFKGDTDKTALMPAIAVEVFHNFTLMHDDIMDEAPLRRGQKTVHEKWNENVAILSGDVMLVKAYDLLLDIPTHLLKTVIQKFNQCAAWVCEGQQLDMNFEKREDVGKDQYLEMIRLKTAVLLGFSLEFGGILAEADEASCQLLFEFGENIGIGFQLKDDLLDVYADQAKFGKQVGGDIISNKKTFLLIEALQKASGETKTELATWLAKTEFDNKEKVDVVVNIYDKLNVKATTESFMNSYFDKGLESLKKLTIPEEKKQSLLEYTENLIDREK